MLGCLTLELRELSELRELRELPMLHVPSSPRLSYPLNLLAMKILGLAYAQVIKGVFKGYYITRRGPGRVYRIRGIMGPGCKG